MSLNKLKLIKNIPIITIILLSCIILFKRCSSQKAKEKNTLTVGMMSGWPPYMSINRQGSFEGFDVDVAYALGKQLNKKIIINDLGNIETLFIALEKGTIDLIFSGLDITQKRLEKLTMVAYTGEGITSFYLLFWNKIPDGVSTLEDLCKQANNTLCIEPASPSENFLNQSKFNAITKKSINRVSDMILELKFGRSIAVILEPIIAQDIIKKNSEIKYLTVPIPKEFQIFGVGIALKKENTKLQKQIQQAIKQLRENKTLQQLEQKWNMPGVQS